MANNPGAGTKFVSVNLNKSYGQPSNNHFPNSSFHGSTRARPGSHGSGGSGMVVLSRPRSSQKTGPKLSVPPPLNLPSLRKEHERFDSLGSTSGPAGAGIPGSGSRPSSSGLGWIRPTSSHPLQDATVEQGGNQEINSSDVVSEGNGVYTPPSSRSGVVAVTAPSASQGHRTVEKAVVLRGEDFPSLKATLSSSVPAQKQIDTLNQKQKELIGDKLPNEKGDASHLRSSLIDIPSQMQSSCSTTGTGSFANGSERHGHYGSRTSDQARKQEYFPLPLIRFNPRSDWADDERDTSHAVVDRNRESRDPGFSKYEPYWDGDFDVPKVTGLPRKAVRNSDRRNQRDDERGIGSSNGIHRDDPFLRTTNRGEGSSWRNCSVHQDQLRVPDDEISGVGGAELTNLIKESGRNNKYMPSSIRDNSHDVGKTDAGYGQGERQPWNNRRDSYDTQGPDQSRYGGEKNNRNRFESFQNKLAPKSSFSAAGKGFPINDPLLNFGRDKRLVSKSRDRFTKDFAVSEFDEQDIFSGSLVGVVKRKKDLHKQTDFHDPVRESFEAELERVQKMQEQERKRIIEEQERALELAQREEEERMRLAREQEERQRSLEEEAREAAWRAEHERIEAMRKAEKQRIAREEEKRMLLIEEERRKQAAKQKLLELEEKIARRQAETRKGSSNMVVADEEVTTAREKYNSGAVEIGDWEDGERMVERITTSASSDSSGLGRLLDMGSRLPFSRDMGNSFMDRGKSLHTWRRDMFENGNSLAFNMQAQDLQRDSSVGGKSFFQEECYGGSGFMSSRNYYKGGLPEPQMEKFTNLKGQMWNISGDGYHYGRNAEIVPDFHENFGESFGDAGWVQDRNCGNPYSQYPDRSFHPTSDPDGTYAFGRSRFSMRQPRVLPPPSLTSMPKSYRGEHGSPGRSNFLETEMKYDHASRVESTTQTGFETAHHEYQVQTLVVEEQKVDNNTAPSCDWQSSLSVSSHSNSPTHLSHDDLEVSVDSPVLSAAGESKNIGLSSKENEPVLLSSQSGNEGAVTQSRAVSTADDDDRTLENDELLQQQEEYDEDVDGYQEDEAHEGDDDVDLNEQYEGMHMEEKDLTKMMDNLVLGFNEGVQVGMPAEDFEGDAKTEESTFVAQQAPVVTSEEQILFADVNVDGKPFQPVDGSLLETGNPAQDKVIQPYSARSSLESDHLNHMEASSAGQTTHQLAPDTINTAQRTPPGQRADSNAATVVSQPEIPFKLQFGLFSGPSLIPSPVPAIQIGSIQMPLHMHPHDSPSLNNLHPSSPPLFQFGQLRYTPPLSQGMVPLFSQSTPFRQPTIPSGFSFNQNSGSQTNHEDFSDGFFKNESESHLSNNQSGTLGLSQVSMSREIHSTVLEGNTQSASIMPRGEAGTLLASGADVMSASSFQAENNRQKSSVVDDLSLSDIGGSVSMPHSIPASLQSHSKEKDMAGSKGYSTIYANRAKKFVFAIKGSGPGSSAPVPRMNNSNFSGFSRKPGPNTQRTEFRVKKSGEKRQPSSLVASDPLEFDQKTNLNSRGDGVYSRSVPRSILSSNKGAMELAFGSKAEVLRDRNSESRGERENGKEDQMKSFTTQSGEGNLRRNLHPDDVDAPLQSGIVRVFEQPGIEAPSDEDNFIEVRSKRQMLNVRREQREREIKAKSRVSKIPRRPRSTAQSSISSMSGVNASNINKPQFIAAEVHGAAKRNVSSGFSTSLVSQPLAPIGTPPLKNDSQANLRTQTSSSLQTSFSVVAVGEKNVGSGSTFESRSEVPDGVKMTLGSWGNLQILPQTKPPSDETMETRQFDSHGSGGNHSSGSAEPSLPSSSVPANDKPFSSASSPINSLLAGEKIQFGAVTSPTVLLPNSRSLCHGIGLPGPGRSEMQIAHNHSAKDNDSCHFFEKEKHSNECNVKDCVAEAEAAASAVAVAAISSDEIVGNGSGTCSVSYSDAKTFVGPDINGLSRELSGNQLPATQLRVEEHFSVSLPADLCVDTSTMSSWPPIPSPQTSTPMFSHFHAGPTAHFPFYEMNPLVGRPIFSFGSHDNSSSSVQSHSQKSNVSAPGPVGNWQKCQSNVESFYGPPAGFTDHFISPPGGIPAVQGPPHMVVYNHFAPVGQFGHVGLSFMGTNYIPSGKQPDWKHNPSSSAVAVHDGDVNSLYSSHRNPSNISTPIQNLAPGSPLMPMASPLAMYDVSPFQSPGEIPIQTRWPHFASSSVQTIPASLPLQQQEAVNSSPFSRGTSANQSIGVNRFHGSQPPVTSNDDRSYSTARDVHVTELPHELEIVDSLATCTEGLTDKNSGENSSIGIASDGAKADVGQSGSNHDAAGRNSASPLKNQSFPPKNTSMQQHTNSSGYSNYQRATGAPQKNGSGVDWFHRRISFQGRKQSMSSEKSFSSTKMKQMYVAKQSTSGASTVS